jgi:hypothetical protein
VPLIYEKYFPKSMLGSAVANGLVRGHGLFQQLSAFHRVVIGGVNATNFIQHRSAGITVD